MYRIDLNSDLGESFGRYTLGLDDQIIPLVSSANVACGQHAGDPMVMRDTVRMAADAGIAIGAHPGYPDLQGFGRRDMNLSPDEAYSYMLYQIGALQAFCAAAGVPLRHVKPHGQLYNHAAVDPELAAALAQAVRDVDDRLVLVGLANSALVDEGRKIGLVTGRTHQIRAHLAYLGKPVLGDIKYGNRKMNERTGTKTQALCAVRITFREIPEENTLHDLSGKVIKLKDPQIVKQFDALDKTKPDPAKGE